MPGLYLRQPKYTYSACGPFTRHRESIWKFRVIGDLNCINKNKLDKTCFADIAAYADNNDLVKRTASDKILKDRAYEIALNFKYDGYQIWLASMLDKFFNKK